MSRQFRNPGVDFKFSPTSLVRFPLLMFAGFFLMAALTYGSLSPFYFSCLCAAAYFLVLLADCATQLPAMNIPKLFAAMTGLFYFGGAAAEFTARSFIGADNQFFHMGGAIRSYEPFWLSAAALVVLSCCVALEFFSNIVRFPRLSAAYRQDEYNAAYSYERDNPLGQILILAVIGGAAAILIGSGKMAISGAMNMDRGEITGASMWIVLVCIAAPALLLFVAERLLSKDVGWPPRFVVLACGTPIVVANLTFGRRYLLGLLLILTIIAIRAFRIRVTYARFAAAAGGGLLLFAAVTPTFLAIRSTQSTQGHGVSIGEQISSRQDARLGSPWDLVALSVTRADPLPELAMIAEGDPFHPRLGFGMLSQAVALIPNVFWPGKAEFINRDMFNDYKICADASLPRTDIASTAVLYSFAETSWLACIWFVAKTLALVAGCDLIVRLSRSYTVQTLALSSLLMYLSVPDNTDGSVDLSLIRFLILAGVAVSMINVRTRSGRRAGQGRRLPRPRGRQWRHG